MLFNSVEFAIFLPLVFFLYWFVVGKSLRIQNIFLIAVSYLFYGWWDWRFLFLIVFSSFVDFLIGRFLLVAENEFKRKCLLWISISVNLGFLGFFKYFNFFADSFSEAFTLLGVNFDPVRLNILLPVGISFYTFQTLSYSIDVYKRKLEPTKDIISFFAFVSFFPQLVAGPIERATNLLPQFYVKRVFDYRQAVDGLKQILWGLFKKIVIADHCAIYANDIFNNSSDYSGNTLLIGAVFFAFQIYGDFSGYSDIAIGISRLFGFNLMKNFSTPYFSRDIAEFWRRWHISLSTWFRDYVYIPLGGSRGGTWMKVRNTFIIFTLSGFWHGANWTFIIWGILNAIYFLPLLLLKNNRKNVGPISQGKLIPSLRDLFSIISTFILTVFAWIFFRAQDVNHAINIISEIFSSSIIQLQYSWMGGRMVIFHTFLVVIFLGIEWVNRDGEYGLQLVPKNSFIRWFFYLVLVIIILFSASYHSPNEFIYFQF